MGARAIIDAATLWGSERIINRRHDDPSWPWRRAHVVYDDQTMFLDFLHSLILYEEIIMDNSSLYRLDGSLSTLSEEIFAFLHYINELADFEIIKDKTLARFDTPMSGLNEGWEEFRRKADRVAGDVCDLVRRKIPPSDAPTFYVPWAYRSARHADHEMFEKAAANTRLVLLHSDFDRLTIPWLQYGQVGPIDQDSDTPGHPRAP